VEEHHRTYRSLFIHITLSPMRGRLYEEIVSIGNNVVADGAIVFYDIDS
jgi:hypothetical protein